MTHDMWPLVRLHFSRGFRICTWFGQIRSFDWSNRCQTGFMRSKTAKSQQIHELWHVTPCSTAFFERIPNLYLVWSNSVILSVKSTSNRFFVDKNGKIRTDSWIMTCDPLFDCIFREDSESVLGLVKFGHFTGQIDVKPVFRGQKW